MFKPAREETIGQRFQTGTAQVQNAQLPQTFQGLLRARSDLPQRVIPQVQLLDLLDVLEEVLVQDLDLIVVQSEDFQGSDRLVASHPVDALKYSTLSH